MTTWVSWVLLTGGAVLLLAPSVAVRAGGRAATREGRAHRLLGAAGVVLCGAVLTSEVARLAKAPSGVPKACSYIALGLMDGDVLVALYNFGRALTTKKPLMDRARTSR
ncbi:hypothetical protein [Streptomyces narbonensis]